MINYFSRFFVCVCVSLFRWAKKCSFTLLERMENFPTENKRESKKLTELKLKILFEYTIELDISVYDLNGS